MQKRQIILKGVEDAKAFVTMANKCDFEVDVYYNRMIIDAKSILGVLSLDLSQPLTVEYTGHYAEWEEFLDDHSHVTVVA